MVIHGGMCVSAPSDKERGVAIEYELTTTPNLKAQDLNFLKYTVNVDYRIQHFQHFSKYWNELGFFFNPTVDDIIKLH